MMQCHFVILMLKFGVWLTAINRTHSARYISVPLAVLMSSRSMTDFQPNQSATISRTLDLAFASFPLMKMSWGPGIMWGVTITLQLMVLSVFTTFTSGNALCICSPSESVLHTVRVGGMPLEKSSGFEMSTRILPFRFFAPANFKASSEAAPGAIENYLAEFCGLSERTVRGPWPIGFGPLDGFFVS